LSDERSSDAGRVVEAAIAPDASALPRRKRTTKESDRFFMVDP
jgi:hypothetical protein